MSTLNELTQQMAELAEVMAVETDKDRKAHLQRWMDVKGTEQEKKLNSFGHYIQQVEREVEAATLNFRYWSEKKRKREHELVVLKDLLRDHFLATGTVKVRTASFRYTLKTSGMRAVQVDESKLPEEYYRPQTPAIDKMKIRAALEAGVEVPGASFGKAAKTVVIS